MTSSDFPTDEDILENYALPSVEENEKDTSIGLFTTVLFNENCTSFYSI